MTEQAATAPESFFDNVGGSGAPSFKFDGLNSGVIGTIIDQFATVVKTDTGEPKLDKNGNKQPQLNVTLQTTLRNYEKVPVDPANNQPRGSTKEDGSPREDDGTRRIYIKYNMREAIGRALKAAEITGGLRNGGTLGVKVVGFKDVGKTNPLPQYEATYTAPSVSAGFDFETESGAPSQDAPPAADDPWGAATQPVQSAPAQTAPAAAPAVQTQTEEPPF